MPLILAIEPDRRQASRIGALKRGLVNAEILIVDSTERAIAALEGRVPDLILTSLLLSPKDEAGLREWNGAGTHVQMLMIPVLAAASRPANGRRGLLTHLRRGRKDTGGASQGCDPAVFAAQIAEYLDRGAREREALDVEVTLATLSEIKRAVVPDLEPAALSESAPTPIAAIDRPPLLEIAPIAVAAVPPAPIPEHMDALFSEIEAMLAEFELDELDELDELNGLNGLNGDDTWEDIALDDDESSAPTELTSERVDLGTFVEELDALIDNRPTALAQPADSDSPPPRVAIANPLPVAPMWPALEGMLVDEALVDDFVAVLEDVPDLGEEEPDENEADSDLWTPLPAAFHDAWPRLQGIVIDTTAQTGGKRPVEDEWGFFDPEQCGFRALLTKLDEITKQRSAIMRG